MSRILSQLQQRLEAKTNATATQPPASTATAERVEDKEATPTITAQDRVHHHYHHARKRKQPSDASDKEKSLRETTLATLKPGPVLNLFRFVDSFTPSNSDLSDPKLSDLWFMNPKAAQRPELHELYFDIANYVTPRFLDALKKAHALVKTCGNPAVDSLPLSTLIQHSDLEPWFSVVVRHFVETKPSVLYKGVSVLRMAESVATQSQAIVFFENCEKQPVNTSDETTETHYADGVRYRLPVIAEGEEGEEAESIL